MAPKQLPQSESSQNITKTDSKVDSKLSPPPPPQQQQQYPKKVSIYQNYRLHYHTLLFILTIIASISYLRISIACLRDHPDMRLIFAMLFRTQQDNFAVHYGGIVAVFIAIVLYVQLYLLSEHYILRWDFAVYQTRRRVIKHLFFTMVTSLIILSGGLLFQLSRIMPWEKITTEKPYYFFYKIPLIWSLTAFFAVLGHMFYSIDVPLYVPTTKTTTNLTKTTGTTTTGSKASILRQKLQQQRDSLPPLNENNIESAFKELKERFPDSKEVDMFGKEVYLQPLSRFDNENDVDNETNDVSHSDDDDSESDNEDDDSSHSDEDEDDEGLDFVEKLDNMVAEMTEILSKGTQNDKTATNNENLKKKID